MVVEQNLIVVNLRHLDKSTLSESQRLNSEQTCRVPEGHFELQLQDKKLITLQKMYDADRRLVKLNYKGG